MTSLELFDDVFLVDISVKAKNINHPICSVSLTIKPMRYIVKYEISYKLASTCSAILLTRTRLFCLSKFFVGLISAAQSIVSIVRIIFAKQTNMSTSVSRISYIIYMRRSLKVVGVRIGSVKILMVNLGAIEPSINKLFCHKNMHLQ